MISLYQKVKSFPFRESTLHCVSCAAERSPMERRSKMDVSLHTLSVEVMVVCLRKKVLLERDT